MITLAQAKVTMVDPVDQMVVDEFRRSSQLMDLLPFANDVAPATGGQTLVYGYTKLKTPSIASFRGLNEEYTPGEAIKERKNAYLKILGGSFKLDRVVIGTAGAVDELNFQLKQKIAAATNLFHYTVINGNATSNEEEFDGLATLLAGSSTEKSCATDISTSALMDANYNAFLDEVTEWLATLAEKPTALLMNSKMLTKMKSIARRAGYYSRTEDAFGRTVDNWDNIPMLDMGQYFNGTKSVNCVPNEAGHALQSYLSMKTIDIPDIIFPTMESCEIHSMSMEFFAFPYLELFFGKDSDKYKYHELAGALTFLPYGCLVDHFQHEVYKHPEMSPVERKNTWRRLEKLYKPDIEYTDFDILERGGYFYRQGHIFQSPFYYIDYTLAQVCALQFFKRFIDNDPNYFKDYLHICSIGGTKSFVQIVKEAGLISPFEDGCLASIASVMEDELNKLEEKL